MFASLATWLATQIDKRIALAAYPGPDEVWPFNPFAWQALFLLGVWLGWRGTKGGVPWLRNCRLFGRGGPRAGRIPDSVQRDCHGLYDPTPVLFSGRVSWLFLSKTDLGLFRFANVLAVALLVARLIHPQARFLAGRVAWPFVICGRNSLHIFCLGILLSLLGHLVLNEFFGGIPMQFTVSGAGIAIMISVAALMEWFGAAQAASGRMRPWGADGGKRSTRMTPALLRYVIVAVSLGLLPSPVEAFSQARDCPVPERFYAFGPSLTKTVKASSVAGRSSSPCSEVSSTLGLAGRRAQLGLACASGRRARQEVPVCSHQGSESRGGTPDGEDGGRAP